MVEEWVLGGHENQEFGFGHAKFEILLGHPFGTLEEAAGFAMLGLEGGQAADSTWTIAFMLMEKARILDETNS